MLRGVIDLVILLQQVSTSTAWDATPSNGLSRTNSMPDNFGSSTNGAAGQQAAAMPTTFTVTTGDVIMRTTSGEGPAASEALVCPCDQNAFYILQSMVIFYIDKACIPFLEEIARSVTCVHAGCKEQWF